MNGPPVSHILGDFDIDILKNYLTVVNGCPVISVSDIENVIIGKGNSSNLVAIKNTWIEELKWNVNTSNL